MKIIPAETQYKTHDDKFLANVETFETVYHYLKDDKYEVFILTNYNNLYYFTDTKSLSSRWIYLVQELFQYHFQINYCQGKTNRATDAIQIL